MRVYVPLTLSRLAEVHKAGELGPAPLTAYAVTPSLREWVASDDVEELEYAALYQAAAASLRLIAGEAGAAGAAPRRVVVAADVPDAGVEVVDGAESLGEVRVAGVLGLKKVAAVHVDAGEAEADVAAAVSAGGSGDAVEDHELLWFATQEIPSLIG
ncbi:hypothetical protein GCM10010277_13870 [Streptomyces longisporoflavus]|uniref:DUF6912 family protein n=1 Tax=Streptomyces longisporoflavus TaxID=28044 RepID=UPI00167C759A|nr:hypothetical protein [Streptomyces longisporoflavus]GGV30710.1 hypothetical protein GCM10010277_13870 [Streptomyces longisporoflavus]